MPTAPDSEVAGADSGHGDDARSSSPFRANDGIDTPPFRAVLDQMPVGVMIAEAPSGKVTYANRQAAAIFGGPVTPTESTDQLERTFEAWHPDGRRLHANEFPLARGVAGETVQGQEVRFRKPDGTVGVVRASASAIRDPAGNIVGGITTFYDVSIEKQFEERLREESRINETLYRLGASFAKELDEQKLLQLITDEATSLTGAKFGSFFFNVVDEQGESYMLYTLSGVPREAFAGFPMPRNTAIFAPTFSGEAVLRLDDVTKDPRYGKSPPYYGHPPGHLPVRSYLAVPVVARSGAVLGGLFFGHPETGRFAEQHERIVVGAAAQAAVALENARLYRGVKESEERAQRAYEKAFEADRRKDEFLAMLGHELRNPLAPIVTALELMRLRNGDAAIHERSVIERQVGHLSRLVDDLLDVSRITQGKIELKRSPVQLNEAIGKAIEIASPLLEQHGHNLALDVPVAGLVVDGDPVRLAQVFANLLTNAAKYTQPGGRIALSARREGDEIVVTVRDNGTGIEKELLARIFDLFTQGKRSLDRAQGGLGLGLTLVRSLVEMHGGRVRAASEGPGKGSEFTVVLPSLEEQAIVRQEPRASAARPAPQRSRVLVVDDNTDAADLLAEALRAEGHEVRVAADALEALSLAHDFAPRVALLDIGLPVMDGYELAHRLKSDPALAHLRLVAISGYGQEADRRRSLEAGFEEHLVKPVELGEVLALVNDA